jgi:hypothetical protein
MTSTQPDLPAPADVVDLDRARAARREGHGDAIEVRNKGQAFRLPIEMPIDAVERLADLAELGEKATVLTGADASRALRQVSVILDGGLAVLFCDEEKPPKDGEPHADGCQWPRFLDTKPTLNDKVALVEGVFAAYGVSLGEALASTASSATGGRRSPRTSKTTTGSTRGTSGGGRRKTTAGGRR